MSQPAVSRFSTVDVPERHRLAMFREVFGLCTAMDITPLGEECQAEAEFSILPGAHVMWGGNSAHRFKWGGHLAKSDDCLLTWATSPVQVQHLGRKTTVAAGPAMLMSCADDATIEHPSHIEHVTVAVPRSALKSLIVRGEDVFMQSIPAETAALRLLKSYLATVRDHHETTSVDLQRSMVLHICDLIAFALGATRDAAELANTRGIPAARLDAMKKSALEHLSEPAFSVRDVARMQNVSPRYVQMLFERDGTTFSSFVLQSRLALAHRRLSDPTLEYRSISTIAGDCGFGDLSYFNQAFRRTYGETPSDVRARARSAGSTRV